MGREAWTDNSEAEAEAESEKERATSPTPSGKSGRANTADTSGRKKRDKEKKNKSDPKTTDLASTSGSQAADPIAITEVPAKTQASQPAAKPSPKKGAGAAARLKLKKASDGEVAHFCCRG